ncbi:MAG: GrpB family protein [Planctomycetaceae bacterium]|nr:GrpB family protein [Planctomycetaceae bacterium]
MPPPIKVELEPYSSQLKDRTDTEIERLSQTLADCLIAIHHIGSTAIPGIHAKPIIDLLPVTTDLRLLDERQASFECMGYRYWGEYGIAGRRYCTRDCAATSRRLVQLHCFQTGSSEIEKHLAFRDYLLDHPAEAMAYDREKRRCRDLHPDDSHAYSDAKAAWITALLPTAIQYFRTKCAGDCSLR